MIRFDVTMRDPESGRNIIVEVSARSQFEARDKAAEITPFHGVVHVQQVQQVQR